MGIFFNENLISNKKQEEVLNEVYFGKTPRILEMEEIIKQLKSQVNTYTTNGINSSPLVLKFNRLVEEEFGFKSFALYITPSKITNAFTLPVSNRLDVSNENKKIYSEKGQGFKFEKSAEYSAVTVISTGILGDSRFTSGEIMAILLHEIGHSFATSISTVSHGFSFLNKSLYIFHIVYNFFITMVNPLNVGNLFQSVFTFNKFIGSIAEIINKVNNKSMWKVYNFFSDIVGAVKAIGIDILYTGALFNPAAIVFSKAANILYSLNPISILDSIGSYNDEKVSDNFATMYGYGPELASALKTMGDIDAGLVGKNIIYNLPIMGHMYRLIEIPFDFLSSPLECHPQTIQRAKVQLQYLENELKRGDLDPKMKKTIQEQIYECQDLLDEMTNKYNKIDMTEPRAITAVYDRFLLHCFGTGDIRDKFYSNQRNFDDYNKALDDAVQRYKNKK